MFRGLLANFDDWGEGRQIEGMNLLSHLLPDRSRVRLETSILNPGHYAITLILRARQVTACCPLCGRRSKRVHSRYERTLADLPWGTYAITVRLRCAACFCRNCPLRAPHFHRASARDRAAMGAPDAAPGWSADRLRPGAWRQRRRAPWRQAGIGGQPQHAAAPGSASPCTARRDPVRSSACRTTGHCVSVLPTFSITHI